MIKMTLKPKHNFLRDQVAILILSVLFVLAVVAGAAFFMPKTLRSYVPEELDMPAGSRPVLGEVGLTAENAKLDGWRFIPGKEDPQLRISFPDGFTDPVRSIQFLFGKAFESETAYSLFYLKNGDFSADTEIKGTIPAGGDGFFAELPEDAPNPPGLLRLDIESEYELKDMLISADRLYGLYDVKTHRDPRLAAVLFMLVVMMAELVYFFRRDPQTISGRIAGVCIGRRRASLEDTPDDRIRTASEEILRSADAVIEEQPDTVGGQDAAGHSDTDGGLTDVGQPNIVGEPGTAVQPAAVIRPNAGLRYFLTVLLCCLPVLFMWASIVRQRPKLGWRVSCFIVYPALLAGLLLFALLFRKYVLLTDEAQIRWQRVYLLTLFALATAYMFIYLPMMSPDERTHYFSAYRIANLFLGKGTGLGERRIILRAEDYEVLFAPHLGGRLRLHLDVLAMLHPFRRSAGYVVAEAPFATNAVLCYLPSACGIILARLCNLSGIGTFYMSRLVNFIFCLGVLSYLMKKHAAKEAVLFSVMGMPMMLHLMASCSYDAATFCCVQLFVFQVLRIASMAQNGTVSGRELTECVIYAALMAPAKTVYCPLLLLVFLIPGKGLGEKKTARLARRMMPMAAGAFSLMLTGGVIRWLSTSTEVQRILSQNAGGHIVSWSGEEGYTLMHILKAPVDFFFLCGSTLIRQVDEFFFSMLGSRLGRYEIDLPLVLLVVSFLGFLATVYMDEEGKPATSMKELVTVKELVTEQLQEPVAEQVRIPKFTTGQKLFGLLLCAGCVGSVVLAMALSWTPLSSETVQGVQGRYFLPLLPLLAFVIRDGRIRVGQSFRRSLVFVTFVINVWMLAYAQCQIIFDRLP